MQQKQKIWERVKTAVLPAGITAVFIVLASKIAFASASFLAYDESYHYGLIQLYSKHLSPFLGKLPASANQFGAVARDGSYIYHYLLSFPLRLMEVLGLGESAQIMVFRSFSILLGLITLYLAYKVSRSLGIGQWGAQLVSLGLAITPVFHDLFAQINYDTLMIPLTLGSVLLAIEFSRGLRLRKLNPSQLLGLGGLLMLSTLVKYSFLPIAAVIFIYLCVEVAATYGVARFGRAFIQGLRAAPMFRTVILVVFFAASSVLWAQRYGVNMVVYHTPHPQCDVVLSVEQCQAYLPWARNYELHQTIGERPFDIPQLRPFAIYWVRAMYSQLFATTEVVPGASIFNVDTSMSHAGAMIVGVSLPFAFYGAWTLKRVRRHWILPMVVCLGYSIALWVQNFSDHNNLHAFVAIQGRYLLPVLALGYAFVAYGFTMMTTLMPRLRVQTVLASLLARSVDRELAEPGKYTMTYDLTPIK